MKLLNHILDMFYPKRCIYCSRVIDKNSLSCGKCSLPRVGKSTCSKCGRDLKYCICSNEYYSFMSAVAPFYYKGNVKKVLLQMKHGDLSVIPSLSEEVCLSLERSYGREIIEDIDLITYVPLHKNKLSERGFDQAQLLAEEIGKYFGLKVENVLTKIKEGTPQHELNAAQRRINVKGMYSCNADLSGMNILLIDDIFTTGSTLSECAKQLIKCGAICVIAAAVALAEPNEYMISAAQQHDSDNY